MSAGERGIFTRGTYERDDLGNLRVGLFYFHVRLSVTARELFDAPEVDVTSTTSTSPSSSSCYSSSELVGGAE